MQAHDRTDDGQAQSGAALRVGAAAVDPVKAVEQMRQRITRISKASK
jgi:hypothetical protein